VDSHFQGAFGKSEFSGEVCGRRKFVADQRVPKWPSTSRFGKAEAISARVGVFHD